MNYPFSSVARGEAPAFALHTEPELNGPDDLQLCISGSKEEVGRCKWWQYGRQPCQHCRPLACIVIAVV